MKLRLDLDKIISQLLAKAFTAQLRSQISNISV